MSEQLVQQIDEMAKRIEELEAENARLKLGGIQLFGQHEQAERENAELKKKLSLVTFLLHDEECDCDGCVRYKAALPKSEEPQ